MKFRFSNAVQPCPGVVGAKEQYMGKQKYRAGDIIVGTEGDGKTWGNTSTLLIIHADDSGGVVAATLKSVDVVTGAKDDDTGDVGLWCLSARPWQRIGHVQQVASAADAIHDAISNWEQLETSQAPAL